MITLRISTQSINILLLNQFKRSWEFHLAIKKSKNIQMKRGKKPDLKPIIKKVDKSLDKYLSMGLFQDKVDKANEMLRTVGLPKGIMK